MILLILSFEVLSHEVLASITIDALFCNNYNRFTDPHRYRMNAYMREKAPPPPQLCRLVALSELTRPNSTNAPFLQN